MYILRLILLNFLMYPGASLEGVIDYLNENPQIKISIEGHTDDVGSEDANLALSAERAFTVKGYLEGHDIDPDRLKFKGWGESKPVASNVTAEGRARNRRIEIVILD